MSVRTNALVNLNSGYKIPVVGLGVYLTQADIAPKAVYTALKAGYRHVDSARIYRNERDSVEGILRYLEDHPEVKREEIFYTTKIWDGEHGYEATKAAIEESLDRLSGEPGPDGKAKEGRSLRYIDLVLIHSPQSSPEKRLGTWRALQEAVAAGTIKSIGVSNYGEPHIRELLEWDGLKVKPAVNQIELHPWLQRRKLVKFLRDNDIVPEAYSPLTRAQKLDDMKLSEVAKKYGKSPAQILVKWSLQAGFVTLPKSVHEQRIIENIDIDDFELTEEDFNSLGDKDLNGVTGWDPTVYPIDKNGP